MKNVLIAIILSLLIGAFWSIVDSTNHKLKYDNRKVRLITITLPLSVFLVINLYNNTYTLLDFSILILIYSITFAILIWLDLLSKNKRLNIYINIIFSSIAAFFMIYLSNFFVMSGHDYTLLIVITLINVMNAFKHNKIELNSFKKIKEFIIYAVILIIVLTSLFKTLDVDFNGTSKAKQFLKSYLINELGYKESEMRSIEHAEYNRKNKSVELVVYFYNPEAILYTLQYKNGEVIIKK